jgi:hypothetical protein
LSHTRAYGETQMQQKTAPRTAMVVNQEKKAQDPKILG